MLQISFDPFSSGRTATPRAAAAGADAGSSRTAPAGDGFGRLVQALSGQAEDSTNGAAQPAQAPVAGDTSTREFLKLLANVDATVVHADADEIGDGVVKTKSGTPDDVDADELIAFLAELERRARADAPGDAPVTPVTEAIPVRPVVDVPVASELPVAAQVNSQAPLLERKETDHPGPPEEKKTKTAPPMWPNEQGPTDETGETPPSGNEDRTTKLPPLAPTKGSIEQPIAATSDVAFRPASLPGDAENIKPIPAPSSVQPTLETRAAAPIAARSVDVTPKASAPVVDSRAAADAAPVVSAETFFRATGAQVQTPQTPDARRADDVRIASDRVTAYTRTSPSVSLNDLATADRVERPASSTFDTRSPQEFRPATERASAPAIVVPAVSAPAPLAAPVSNVTIVSTLEHESTSVASQIVDAIRLQWTRGGGEAQVTLEPKYLGPLSVTVRIERDTVSATVVADTPAVREWLRANETLLRQGLGDQGLRLDRLEIVEPALDTPRRDQESHDQPRQRQEQPKQPKRHDAEGALFDVVL